MPVKDSRNFKQISPLVTTSGVVGASRLKELAAEGYAVVINLLPNESDYAVANEAQIVEAQNVKYVHIPVDFKNPTRTDYDQFVLALDEAKARKVHIHCAANYRVSAFYSLYAQLRGLWSESEAEAFVQSLWNPQAAEGWPEFITQVKARGFST